MSIWKRLFGDGASKGADEIDTYQSVSTSGETRRVAALIERAAEFYPRKDPARALELFQEAIALVSEAPPDKATQEARDLTSIGDAFWMAWVCLDMLNRPQEETASLLEVARRKSPMTAARIEERIAESRLQEIQRRETEAGLEVLQSAEPQDAARMQEAWTAIRATGAWWDLRDAGVALAQGKRYEAAWEVLQEALVLVEKNGGNAPSILVAMGDVRKAEGRHGDATSCYLRACIRGQPQPVKRALDQTRIGLKRAGVVGDAEAIRDELIQAAALVGETGALARLDRYLSAAAG